MSHSSSVAVANSVNNSRNQQHQAGRSGSSGLFAGPMGGTRTMSSLVRLALSSNFSSGLLSARAAGGGASGAASSQHVSVSDSEQVSLEEFLESCRATSLLAELEDEEELPDADDDDNDEDDDEEDYENNYDEDGFDMPSGSGMGCVSSRNLSLGGRRKAWDDEHVLKRKFSALIPAFDPRPGRTNVNQTSDLEVPPPDSDVTTTSSIAPSGDLERRVSPDREGAQQPRLQITVRGPNLPGIADVEVDLTHVSEWSIFRAVQHIIQTSNMGSKADKIRRVWEPTYVITYSECKVGELGCDGLGADDALRSRRSSSSTSYALPQLPILSETQCTMDEVLQLLRHVYVAGSAAPALALHIQEETFHSKKTTNKLVQQLQDPLVLASNALPDWCQELMLSCPMLFPFETRLLYFQCTAFGASRSIVWLQNQRDMSAERARSGHGGALARSAVTRGDHDLVQEFRLGRIKHERVKVPRGDRLLDWAVQVMRLHADRKAILEVEFKEEEGTGLGPTLEFYALIAAELQRRDLCMWICDDNHHSHQEDEGHSEQDASLESKPAGFYVLRHCGLFPAPLPQTGQVCDRVCRLFWFLGVFMAKALQDNRLVDLPLSSPFLKMLCQGEGSSAASARSKAALPSAAAASADEAMTSSVYSALSEQSDLDSSGASLGCCQVDQAIARQDQTSPWFAHLLALEDLLVVDPSRGEFLRQLQELSNRKQALLARSDLSEEEKATAVETLTLHHGHEEGVALEDLHITFEYSPSSSVYGFHSVELLPSGEHELVTVSNVEIYLQHMLDFTLVKGIQRQMEAFRSGFSQVFPLDKLGSFSPDEVKTMLCGDQCPVFTKEDIVRYTEPKLGYSRDSPAFHKFVNVLVNFNAAERKAFLQFATGCSSLPPGGLANLFPRLTIVRKIDAGDGSYPSVNTCVHYLKLPDYSSEEIMRERLLMATREKGFYLN